jgi:hypothetical protein
VFEVAVEQLRYVALDREVENISDRPADVLFIVPPTAERDGEMKPAMERIDLGTEELNQLLERARELLSKEDYRKLKAAVDTLEYLTELVADKDTTIRHLRQLLLPTSTEKTKDVPR